jgi:hypothetical protein
MSNTMSIIEELTLEQLGNKKYQFRIPLYQRKYAWTSDEVNALLDDLKTFSKKQKKEQKYFIGNIVVENKDGIYDIIDGQQRFTTLYVMAKIAGLSYYQLHYEIREDDDEFLKEFEYVQNLSIDYKNADRQFKENIEEILKFQQEHLHDDLTLASLLGLCKITLTILPDGIDIVKYFEVMNNRGRQLEKHQILKAKLLEQISSKEEFKKCITQDDTINYAKIWDYCSNMNVYIEDSIYYGDLDSKEREIDGKVRDPIKTFLNGKDIPCYFKNLESTGSLSIAYILKNDDQNSYVRKEEFYIRQEYGSIVKFPIFIMQVFKVFISQEENKDCINLEKLVVNDGHLISYFYNENKEFIFDCKKSKAFILFMLRMRLLYDYFIFKRDGEEKPILGGVKTIISLDDSMSKNILMLQLLFNFTAPQRLAQDWLAVALKWLNENYSSNDFYNKYFNFIENFDRIMAKERLSEDKNLIGLINHYLAKNEFEEKECSSELFIDNAELNNGTSTPHYWFYKLDYLLWKNNDTWKNLINQFAESNRFKYTNIKSDFRLSRLNSIEHMHPQSKADAWNNGTKECQSVDNFGNLALISNHMNSALNAQQDIDKRLDIQKQLNNGTIESLKMILAYSQYNQWNPENCVNHHNDMIDLLIQDIKCKGTNG